MLCVSVCACVAGVRATLQIPTAWTAHYYCFINLKNKNKNKKPPVWGLPLMNFQMNIQPPTLERKVLMALKNGK